MKKMHFWLVMCLVSVAHGALFVWASWVAVMRELDKIGAAAFMIVLI